MTKEELEKEAREYADWFWGASPSMMKALAEAYIKGAEPREKLIAELEQKIKSLEGNSSLHEGILWNDIHNQDKKIAELEAQIEKMKNCRNCKNEKIEGACGHFTQVGWCKDWELSN